MENLSKRPTQHPAYDNNGRWRTAKEEIPTQLHGKDFEQSTRQAATPPHLPLWGHNASSISLTLGMIE
jgi:hypothetical protein